MTEQKNLEHYGHIIKYETLRNVSTKRIPGTLVLEAPEPFPGYLEYYSEWPHPSAPLYIYFIIQGQASLQEVARATQIAHSLYRGNFEAAFAEIKFANETYDAIRVRNLDHFDEVQVLQEIYRKAGIAFHKQSKEISDRGLITIKKLFHLRPVQEDVFLDVGEADQGYFVLPFSVEWEDFRVLLEKVKHNWSSVKSDFALGFFYTQDRIEDVVRVYNPELTPELLLEAKRQFLLRI